MTYSSPDPGSLRAERVYPALARIAERHAATAEARARQTHPDMISPSEAVRLTAMLGGGSVPHMPDEPRLDPDDLTAALTLVPLVRTELDELELSLILVARQREMTWSQIAFALGLGSSQAAQQRHDRLAARQDGN